MSSLFTAYLAPVDLEHTLAQTLTDIEVQHERLFLAKGPVQPAYFAQNIWLHPIVLAVKSISDAARQLKSIQRNWVPYAFHLHRRTQLIQEKLPHVSTKPLHFLQEPPQSALGSWTLLDEHTLLASAQCTSPLPHGEWNFVEDRVNPPSRAYLKLWEFFTRMQRFPQKGEVCLDLGASPGGWTWVLRSLGAEVIAYDRAPLEGVLKQDRGIRFYEGDAFKVTPEQYPEASWVFSDMIAYPEKVLLFLKPFVESCPEKNFVFTLKFQGANPYGIIEEFLKIPNSHLVHLSHNKHELTWFRWGI